MALFIFDYDGTIADGQTHNRIINAFKIAQEDPDNQKSKEEIIWEVASGIHPIGGAKAWQDLFRQLWADGHQIAIASFNSFKPMIGRYLREMIGLNEAEAGSIFIESWLPPNPKTPECKKEHIENILEYLKVSKKITPVILIDDMDRNVFAAKVLNDINGIVADRDNFYHSRVLALSALYHLDHQKHEMETSVNSFSFQ